MSLRGAIVMVDAETIEARARDKFVGRLVRDQIARADLVAPDIADLLGDDDAAFRARFSANPVKRVGHARFLRNLLVAAGNSGDASLAPLVEARLKHESPLARGMAVWALARLAPERLAASVKAAEAESDDHVRTEWAAAGVLAP